MPEDKDLLTAEDLLKSSRDRVKLSNGKQVVICKIGMLEMAEISKALPDVSSIADATKQTETLIRKDPTRMASIIESVVQRGVVSPALAKTRAEGKPVAADFSQVDLMTIFNAIHELSGFTREVSEDTLPLSQTSG